MGSILQTKKRYVGNMFEEVRQAEAALDTKGIEIVRRDSCPAVAKILTRSLVTLFERRSLTEVREYVQRQFMRILANRVSLQDFMFAREVRLGSYRTATVPPAALVAAKCMAQDPRMEPARGERVRLLGRPSPLCSTASAQSLEHTLLTRTSKRRSRPCNGADSLRGGARAARRAPRGLCGAPARCHRRGGPPAAQRAVLHRQADPARAGPPLLAAGRGRDGVVCRDGQAAALAAAEAGVDLAAPACALYPDPCCCTACTCDSQITEDSMCLSLKVSRPCAAAAGALAKVVRAVAESAHVQRTTALQWRRRA